MQLVLVVLVDLGEAAIPGGAVGGDRGALDPVAAGVLVEVVAGVDRLVERGLVDAERSRRFVRGGFLASLVATQEAVSGSRATSSQASSLRMGPPGYRRPYTTKRACRARMQSGARRRRRRRAGRASAGLRGRARAGRAHRGARQSAGSTARRVRRRARCAARRAAPSRARLCGTATGNSPSVSACGSLARNFPACECGRARRSRKALAAALAEETRGLFALEPFGQAGLHHRHPTVDELAHPLLELTLQLVAEPTEQAASGRARGARAKADHPAQPAGRPARRERARDHARQRLEQHRAHRFAHPLRGDHLVDERARDRLRRAEQGGAQLAGGLAAATPTAAAHSPAAAKASARAPAPPAARARARSAARSARGRSRP